MLQTSPQEMPMRVLVIEDDLETADFIAGQRQGIR